MSYSARKLMTVGSGEPVYVEDVFSTYLYTGTAATRQIVNGIDLADKGGMIWTKARSTALGHALHDSEMAAESFLSCDGGAAIYGPSSAGADSYLSLNSDGYSVGSSQFVNDSTRTLASWTFAQQEGFFDVVTYIGDGTQPRAIPHNLGSAPGMMIIKSKTLLSSWVVYHRAMGNQYEIRLNSENDKVNAQLTVWNQTDPTDTVFTVGSADSVNKSGEEFVAYLFAHDAQEFGLNGNESIIQCGGYTGTGNDITAPQINLGWEPQWLLVKNTNAVADWVLLDDKRGWTTSAGNTDALLRANSNATESLERLMGITSTGFFPEGSDVKTNANGNEYVYMAIRKPDIV